MTRGKSICSVLKTIRKQVADAYICHGPASPGSLSLKVQLLEKLALVSH